MEYWKDIADIVQAAAVSAVAVGGGILYLQQRKRYPRASMALVAHHKKVSDEQIFLRVVVTLANIGEVIIRPTKGFVLVRQIQPGAAEFLASLSQPLDEAIENPTCFEWPVICDKDANVSQIEIEPTEEQEFCFDFVISGAVETVLVYSHLENEKKRGRQLGWNKTFLYELTEGESNANR